MYILYYFITQSKKKGKRQKEKGQYERWFFVFIKLIFYSIYYEKTEVRKNQW